MPAPFMFTANVDDILTTGSLFAKVISLNVPK